MTVTPITPDEAFKNKTYPDEVIKCWNDMITEKLRGKSAVILQKDISYALCEVMNATSTALHNSGWLDIEDLYRSYGWKVVYDKPAYNETYDAFFEFTKK